MVIIGAGGFAKEVLEVCKNLNMLGNLVFYDDTPGNKIDFVYNRFPVLTSIKKAEMYFDEIERFFTIGIGNPTLREMMYNKFVDIRGVPFSTISSKADIGSFEVSIGDCANILDGAKISNSVSIGKAVLIYYNSIITHDCVIGDFVEISPNATILGRSKIGDFTHIGANATILPDVIIGKNVKVGAGAVVIDNVADNCTVAGVPAKVIKQIFI